MGSSNGSGHARGEELGLGQVHMEVSGSGQAHNGVFGSSQAHGIVSNLVREDRPLLDLVGANTISQGLSMGQITVLPHAKSPSSRALKDQQEGIFSELREEGGFRNDSTVVHTRLDDTLRYEDNPFMQSPSPLFHFWLAPTFKWFFRLGGF